MKTEAQQGHTAVKHQSWKGNTFAQEDKDYRRRVFQHQWCETGEGKRWGKNREEVR